MIADCAGYGRRCGFGARPALLVVDATYSFCGRTPKPILESIAEHRRSCGEGAWVAVEHIAALMREARRAKIPVIYSAMEDPGSPEYEPGLWGSKNRRGSEDGRAGGKREGRQSDCRGDRSGSGRTRVFQGKAKPILRHRACCHI